MTFRNPAISNPEERYFRDYVRVNDSWPQNSDGGGSWVADRNMAIHSDNIVVARNRISGLLFVTRTASCVPARRVHRIDPALLLRQE